MKQLKTAFSSSISDQNVLPEHPRPSLMRNSFLNLNGLWQYAITGTEEFPQRCDGTILVPFSPESSLSGVLRTVQPDEFLWYRRTLSLPRPQAGNRLLLHFGAVDQYAEVFINRIQAGAHQGGYLPFTVDITDFVFTGDNELWVKVKDVTDASWHSRGKQSLKPGGMFYTAQSGIWQTVWAEIVPDNYIENIFYFPDFDRAQIRIKAVSSRSTPLRCTITGSPADNASRHTDSADTSQRPLCLDGMTNEEITIDLPGFHPWSPEDPFLYQVKLETDRDRASSYFAMRKCDVQTAPDGKQRFFLNNRPYFQAGVLDQGYWPESLYTAPSDEAFISDITRMKQLGFNMLRKHAKIEPERFYYHCDRLGMLVWQDMVNGGTPYKSWFVTYLATLLNWPHISCSDGEKSRKLLSRTDTDGQKEFLNETAETVAFLYNHPCIVCWVPFNEGWGQFDAADCARRIKELDPYRLVDHASGWFDQKGGDIVSLHYYFFSLHFQPEKSRALALTEFGGYSFSVPGHSACEKVYGYKKFDSASALTAGYAGLMEKTVLPAVKKGVSATIYTQLSDIEEETNGIYTYDRTICKLDPDTVRHWNAELKASAEGPKQQKGTGAPTTRPGSRSRPR